MTIESMIVGAIGVTCFGLLLLAVGTLVRGINGPKIMDLGLYIGIAGAGLALGLIGVGMILWPVGL